MKVLFLVTHPYLPSSRFRVYQYLTYLSRENISYDVFPVMPEKLYDRFYGSKKIIDKMIFQGLEFVNRLKHILKANGYDVIFIQKNLLSVNLHPFSFLLKNIKTNIIFDFDDAIYLNTGQRVPAYLRFLEDKTQLGKIINKSRVVIAGNQRLKDYALNFNNNVHIIPTSVDTDYFTIKKNLREDNKINLLWSGSYGTNAYINLIARPVSILAKKYKICLRIISNTKKLINFTLFGDTEIIFKKWAHNDEIENLHQGDIGLAPLDCSEFSQGKCGLKILMYMSCGIPVVASSVGVNREIIQDGINGFLTDNEEDWLNKIGLLIEDRLLRGKIGLEGRKTVEHKYSVRVNAPILKEVIERSCQ